MPLSKIVANSIADDTITSDQIADTSVHGRRNLVINGAMQVAQRGTSTTNAAAFTFFADRFYYESGSMDALALTTAQVADAPADTGIKYSIKATVTTPEVGSGDTTEFAQVNMFLEHQDSSQKLRWGTSSAKPLTVSFYVKSSVTGVFLFTMHKSGGAAGFGTHYTINSANTWEKKTIAVPAATDSSWAALADTGRGIETRWSWRVGSNVTKTVDGNWDYTGGYMGFSNVSNTGGDAFVTTNGATWQLTGVQYEIGEQASPFEHRSFSENLTLCQRYYQQSYDDNTAPGTVTNAGCMIARASSGNQYLVELTRRNIVTMRTTPSVVSYSPNTGAANKVRTSSGDQTVSGVFDAGKNSTGFPLTSGSVSDGDDVRWHFTLSAEV